MSKIGLSWPTVVSPQRHSQDFSKIGSGHEILQKSKQENLARGKRKFSNLLSKKQFNRLLSKAIEKEKRQGGTTERLGQINFCRA